LTAIATPDLVVTYIALTAIIAVRYFVISGAFYALLWKRDPEKVSAVRLMRHEPAPGSVRREIRWSVISSFIYAAPAAIVIEIWKAGGTALYTDIDAYPIWYLPASVLAYLLAHDTYFYWTHRWMHQPRVFGLVHKVHHASRPPTPWAAFSFHYLESIVGAVFVPALVLFVPIHVGGILFILTVMTFAAVLNHLGYEIMPRWWLRSWPGKIFITAAHHDLHHRHYNCNYALYFRFWDQLMGTDRFEGEYDFLADTAEPNPG
jgi:sterol desaturase/sphingolipid hydroxylase (fatty acid hydroxylase superfamily)